MRRFLPPLPLALALLLASCSQHISPDTAPPKVSLMAAPADLTAPGTVNLTATATDNVGVAKVEFYKNGALLTTDPAAPYEAADTFADDAQNGTVSYTARAFDAAGNAATSAPANVTVNVPTPPNKAQVERLRGSWGFTARLSYGVVVFESYLLSDVQPNPDLSGQYLIYGRNTDQDGEVVASFDPPTQSFDLLDPTDQTVSYDRFYTFTFYPDSEDDLHGCYYGVDKVSHARSACFSFEGVRGESAPLGTASAEKDSIPLAAVPEGDPILRRYDRLKQLGRP